MFHSKDPASSIDAKGSNQRVRLLTSGGSSPRLPALRRVSFTLYSGQLLLTRGLPPQLKAHIDSVRTQHPNIKLGALRHYLLEVKQWPESFSKRIEYYHYNHGGNKDMPLGVSAFGTVAQLASDLAMDKVLSRADATLDTTGVIGAELDPEEGRVLVLFTSVKLIMFAFEQLNAGYDNGLALADFTYKIMKEKLAFIAISTVDIQQHNKLTAFGPSSHEDAQAVRSAALFMKTFLDTLVKGIKTSSLPDAWHANVKEAIFKEFSFKVSMRLFFHPSTKRHICSKLRRVETHVASPYEGLRVFFDRIHQRVAYAHALGIVSEPREDHRVREHRSSERGDFPVVLPYGDEPFHIRAEIRRSRSNSLFR